MLNDDSDDFVIAGWVETENEDELAFVIHLDALRENILRLVDSDLHAAPTGLYLQPIIDQFVVKVEREIPPVIQEAWIARDLSNRGPIEPERLR